MYKQILKKVIIVAIAGSFFLPLSTLSAQGPDGEKAAEVNGTVISQDEYKRQLSMFKNQVLRGQKAQLPEALAKRIKDQVIKKLVADELLYQQAGKKGIKVEEKIVDDEINKLKGRFQDEKKYQARLKEMGMTEKSLGDQIRRRITVSKLIEQEIVPRVKVSPEAAKAYYDKNTDKFHRPERVRAAHILMKVENGESKEKKEEARKKLQALQKKILAGEDFSALAKAHSQGPSGERGGDLGYFTRGRMVKPFEEVAFGLAPNEISGIVETQFGYHLIKVLDRQAEKGSSFEEAQPQIMSFLFNEQVRKKLDPYVIGLREKAKVTIYLK